MALTDKQAVTDWDAYRKSVKTATVANLSETPEEKKKRIERLEANPQEWKKYYFKKFHEYPSPAFHKTASDRLINSFLQFSRWYEVRHWVRGMSKTTCTMMDVLYLVLMGKLKNIVYTSSTNEGASAFLERYRVQLDSNDLIVNDYGVQELPGDWAYGSFKTRNGAKFLGVGAGNNPRGNGNEELRVDCIITDDFDSDEECLNIDIINKKWNWWERALFFCVDTAKPYLIIWLGNIIAEDCCVVRAGAMADHTEIINIRDENGVSSWPEKNSEEAIDYQIGKTSYESSQQELFNNPMRSGQTFGQETWGECPPLEKMDFLVSYSDPAYSNKNLPSVRSKIQNSAKSTVLIGYHKNRFFLYKCYLDNMSNSSFIDCMYAMRAYVNGRCTIYNFIENNSLQDPFFSQVLLPLVYKAGDRFGGVLSVSQDTERKGFKWTRIEADLEPLWRLGSFVLNEKEKGDPHMMRMIAQFKAASITSKRLDGPDACQGAVKQIQNRMAIATAGGINTIRRPTNKKRF